MAKSKKNADRVKSPEIEFPEQIPTPEDLVIIEETPVGPKPFSVWQADNSNFILTTNRIKRGYLIVVKFCLDYGIFAPDESEVWKLDPTRDWINICNILYNKHVTKESQ